MIRTTQNKLIRAHHLPLKISFLNLSPAIKEDLSRDIWAYLDSIGEEQAGIYSFDHLADFWQDCILQMPSIVFLTLPEQPASALPVAQELLQQNPGLNLIFIGTHIEHAMLAYQAGACYYLMPPFSQIELERCFSHSHALRMRQKNELSVTFNRTSYQLAFEQLMYLRVADKNTQFFLYNHQKPVTLRCTLKSIEKQLDAPRFLRIFRSCIINMDFVRDQQPEGFRMYDGVLLPIARHEYPRLSRAYQAYILSRASYTGNLITDLTHYKERLLIALQVARISIFEVDLINQKYIFFENAMSIFGVTDETILHDVAAYARLSPEKYQQAVSKYFSHPDDKEIIAHAFQEILHGCRTSYNARMKAGQADYIWCRIDVCPIMDTKGIPIRMIGIITALHDQQ